MPESATHSECVDVKERQWTGNRGRSRPVKPLTAAACLPVVYSVGLLQSNEPNIFFWNGDTLVQFNANVRTVWTCQKYYAEHRNIFNIVERKTKSEILKLKTSKPNQAKGNIQPTYTQTNSTQNIYTW